MRQALADAGAGPEDVDYLNAHGTSTTMERPDGVCRRPGGLRPHAGQIAVSSTKSLMGHLIAAAGAVEAGVCALAIHHGVLPENANLAEPDPECNLDFVCGQPGCGGSGVAISNSFGFGGSNSCLVLRIRRRSTDERQGGRDRERRDLPAGNLQRRFGMRYGPAGPPFGP